MYDTLDGDDDEESDRANRVLNRVALLCPDNPQVVMVDVDRERTVLTVVGPGFTNILPMQHWRAVHAGYNPNPPAERRRTGARRPPESPGAGGSGAWERRSAQPGVQEPDGDEQAETT